MYFFFCRQLLCKTCNNLYLKCKECFGESHFECGSAKSKEALWVTLISGLFSWESKTLLLTLVHLPSITWQQCELLSSR